MIEAMLYRTETSDQGTFGILDIEGLVCHTAEPPWRSNRPGISCIPPGRYLVEPWSSRRFPRSFHVRSVPERSAILTHSGNLSGDRSMGWRSHTLGCILPGLKRGYIEKQKAVLLSASAMNRIREAVGSDVWGLTIR